jgi:propanediol dehydratase large subunit
MRFMDAQRVNLDGFAVADPGLGLVALRSPGDPEPGLVISEGRVTELDGVPEAGFDSLDAFIARHGLDLAVAAETMALTDKRFAHMLVSPDVPRDEVIRLAAGATPAKLARVLRRDAAQACRAVYQHLGLADFSDAHVERAVDAAGSKDLGNTGTLAVVSAANAIREGGLTVLDVVAALDGTGYEAEAERVMAMIRARLAGDYLQTSAIFDEQLRVLSLVTDPNGYAGPGTGYEPSPQRQREIDAIRQQRGVDDLRAEQAASAVPLLAVAGPAQPGQNPRDVVIGVSPAAGRDVWRCLSGLTVTDVLAEMLAGLEEEGCTGRVVRFSDTVDLGRIGLAAARLAGSGIGIGLQGKGTALIHRRDPGGERD